MATLFGLAAQAHGQVHHVGLGPEQALAEAALACIRKALDPTVFAEALEKGQQLSFDEAFSMLVAPRGPGSAEAPV